MSTTLALFLVAVAAWVFGVVCGWYIFKKRKID